jgi:uncharacterized membrane protein
MADTVERDRTQGLSERESSTERLPAPRREQRINVGGGERMFSLGAGSFLTILGLRRGRILPALLGGALLHRGSTGRCRVYEALGIDTARRRETPVEPEQYFRRGIHVEQSFTIRKPAEELYRFWRNFENLPRFMKHLEAVQEIDDKRSHWVASAPSIAGGRVEWDAEIINDEPNAIIAWRALDGADVPNAGSVRFVKAPGDHGTEVRVVIDYIPPAGQVGRLIAKIFGQDPESQIREDLRNFKRLMEAGELPTIQGQPRGTCSGDGKRHQEK